MQYNDKVNFDGSTVLRVWVPALNVAFAKYGEHVLANKTDFDDQNFVDALERNVFLFDPFAGGGDWATADGGVYAQCIANTIGNKTTKKEVNDALIHTFASITSKNKMPPLLVLDSKGPPAHRAAAVAAAKVATKTVKVVKAKAKVVSGQPVKPAPAPPTGPDLAGEGAGGAGVALGVAAALGLAYAIWG